MAFVQYGVALLIALNRMTIIIKMNFFAEKWLKYGRVLMILVVFVPSIATFPFFFNEVYFKYIESGDRYQLTSDYNISSLFTIVFLVLCIVTVLASVFNAMTLIMIKRLVLLPKNLDYQYFLVSVCSTVVLIIGTGITFSMRIAEKNSYLYNVTNALLPFVTDLLSLHQPFVLMIFSPRIREVVLGMVCRIVCCDCCKDPPTKTVANNTSGIT
ncbi:hypothetical protein GCK72_024791 [Caenorhabditis remanei]|uniref:Serpentine receptor class gamma n=1 Tax=Caenorhabditis remanei TaxID=31234 RepID=A0A6A5G111_CAERE|nr:hypothetical protein GCK72_024791 [Caenorhabditis remanei]KAF1748324.1 hypothetical protein GCK72_024791 [Caenorhabditis remanei]